MNAQLALAILAGYFLILILFGRATAKGSDPSSFFTGNKRSPWYIVAFGMIGASLSGITFISVPGMVAKDQWHYFQMVIGYLPGYLIIAYVLLPIYYKLDVVSIYEYFGKRFGHHSHLTGSFFFLLSRLIGASFRLFLIAGVLQYVLFEPLGLPFWSSVATTILLIWIYTSKAGIKTVVWTDTLQTALMLVGLVITIVIIKNSLGIDLKPLIDDVVDDPKSEVFNWDWRSATFFPKQFIAGAFIAITMTGMDQDMMQKNLTCPNLRSAQKNVVSMSLCLLVINLFFLFLGVLLYKFADVNDIPLPAKSDQLFQVIALDHLGVIGGVIFLLGITSAAYSSADSALTSLTTSFCVDFLKMDKGNFKARNRDKIIVHLGFSLALFAVINVFYFINDDSVINSIFKVATYTYGPLLGLFTFGICSKRNLMDKLVPYVCILGPVISYFIYKNSTLIFFGYQIGFELLLINGCITILGLMMISKKNSLKAKDSIQPKKV